MRTGALVLTAATALALAVPATGVADPGDQGPRQQGPQTSDRVPGRVAPYVPPALRTPPVITRDETWPVAPGVTFRDWDQTDARGPIRASLLTLDLATPGLAIDYAGGRRVSQVDTVRTMVEHDHAIAGING